MPDTPTLAPLRLPDASPPRPPPVAIGAIQEERQQQANRGLPNRDGQQQQQQQDPGLSWQEACGETSLLSPMAALSSPLGSAAFSRSLSSAVRLLHRHPDPRLHGDEVAAAAEAGGSRWASFIREARK